MQRILRPLLLLAVLAAAVAGLVACGGGDSGGKKADSDTDVNKLLDQTFSGDQKIDKGKLALTLKGTTTGGSNAGPFDVSFSGPFESQGKTALPKFDFDVSVSAAGQSLKAGAESTGTKAFVNFKGQDYVVSDQVYKQFKQGYEQAAKQGDKNNADKQGFAKLGINPKAWLTNPKNAGEGKVGDEDVIKVTGGVDLPKMLDDLNTALAKAGSLGASGANLPSKITDEQKQAIEKSVQDVQVEIDAAKEDSSLRRMLVTLKAVNPDAAGEKIDATFDLQLTDVGEDQEFPEPSNAKPFEQLLQQFGGLGGLGGATAPGGAGSGSSTPPASSADQEKLKKYTDCLKAAGSDQTKAQKCSTLLG